MSNSPKIVRSHPEWTRERPTREGTFGVRGFNLGAAPGQQFETVVLVRRRDDGHLVCNLHESTSEDRFARWPRLDALSDAFEWIEYAPVDRSLGSSDFAQWLASEMPAGTIIGSPAWWAQHILHRLARDLAPPAPAAFPTGADDADTEQFRRGWQAGFAEGRLQPATVTQPADGAPSNAGEPYVPGNVLGPAIRAFNATRQAMTEALRAQGPEGKMGTIETLAIEAALKVALSIARPPIALPAPGDQGSVQELFNPLPAPDPAMRKRGGQVYEQAMAAGATHGQAWRAALTAILADTPADSPAHQPGQAVAPSIAAPLAPQPAAFDFAAHLQHQREWSERTFGPGPRTAGVIDHIRKELREIEAAPHDGEEWIDAVILALDGAWRSGMTPTQIIETLVAKQKKNEGRTWPDWRTAGPDKAIEHDRAGEQEPTADATISTTDAAAHQGTAKLLFGLGEAKALVECFGGSNSAILVQHLPESQATIEQHGPLPAGLYAWFADYPDEGAIFLGGADTDTEEHDDAPSQPAAHPDDAAVDAFATEMKWKLADARLKGRGGWDGNEPGMQQRLSDMLRAHVDKGDPRDVANFAMFLHQRGEGILPAKQAMPNLDGDAAAPLETTR